VRRIKKLTEQERKCARNEIFDEHKGEIMLKLFGKILILIFVIAVELAGKPQDINTMKSSIIFDFAKVSTNTILEYTFVVELWDTTGNQKLAVIKAGDPVSIHITPYKTGSSTIFPNSISSVKVSLFSGYSIILLSNGQVLTLDTIAGGKVTITAPVIFSKVPASNFDTVVVKAKYFGTPFEGISDKIQIFPGDPEKLLFMSPPSKGLDAIYPGTFYNVSIVTFDKYDNKFTGSAEVSLASDRPLFGDIYGSKIVSSIAGTAYFKVAVGDSGMPYDTFKLTAKLVSNGATDYASMVIQKKRVSPTIVNSLLKQKDIQLNPKLIDLQGRTIGIFKTNIPYKSSLNNQNSSSQLPHGIFIIGSKNLNRSQKYIFQK
jgi:hypothetical protein